jgi:hypothetical protein
MVSIHKFDLGIKNLAMTLNEQNLSYGKISITVVGKMGKGNLYR